MADYDREEAEIGAGKRLEYSDDGETGWEKIPGTVEITLPQRELGEAEFTNDDSEDFHKEFVPSMYDPGTVPFTYKYSPTSFAAVEELFMLASDAETRSEAIKYWRVTQPNTSTAIWRGWLKKNELPLNLEEVPTVSSEIRVTGKMTFTPPSGS